MPGWISSAGSGPLTWMLSNATLIGWIRTAWINVRMVQQHQRKGRLRRRQRGQTANATKRNEMKIKVTSIYVDDQAKALNFYTDWPPQAAPKP